MTGAAGDKFTYSDEPPRSCKILPGRERRELMATPAGPVTVDDNRHMSEAGFDKSLTLSVYFKQVCNNCDACKPTRILVRDYVPSASDRQVVNRNRDLRVTFDAAPDPREHQPLFLRNFEDRHQDSYDSFERNVIRRGFNVAAIHRNPMVPNSVMEIRDPANALVGAAVFDDAGNGLKGHYYYYQPGLPAGRSLGTFMVLKLVEHARALDKDYVYLGALTREPSKVSYKARFKPLEILDGGAWVPFAP